MKNKHFKTDGGQYKTTLMPGFLLRLKAKIDSRRGEGAVRAHVQRMIQRVYVMESREYLQAEEILKEVRQSAAHALFLLGSITPEAEGNDKVTMQQNRSILSARSKATATVIEANEKINNIHSVFTQRCLRIRRYNDTKLQQYFSGLTIGFDRSYAYSDDARTRYLSHHGACDRAIARFAAEAYEIQDE